MKKTKSKWLKNSKFKEMITQVVSKFATSEKLVEKRRTHAVYISDKYFLNLIKTIKKSFKIKFCNAREIVFTEIINIGFSCYTVYLVGLGSGYVVLYERMHDKK